MHAIHLSKAKVQVDRSLSSRILEMTPVVLHVRIYLSVFFLFWHIEHGIALGWVGEEEKKEGEMFLTHRSTAAVL